MPITTLTMMPCGCVVDIVGMNARSYINPETGKGHVVECPFCAVTCSLDDLEEWTRENREEIVMRILNAIKIVLPLISHNGKVLEIMEFCGCGYPIVRDMRDIHSHFHLRVNPQETTRLRN